MKTTAKQFALSLYESAEGKTAGEVKIAVKKFVELLALKGRLSQGKKIIEEFGKIWNEKRGIVEAEAVSANELDNASVKLLENYILKLSGAKSAIVKERIDKSLLGGVVIRYGDKVIDGSLKMALEELKEKMVK